MTVALSRGERAYLVLNPLLANDACERASPNSWKPWPALACTGGAGFGKNPALEEAFGWSLQTVVTFFVVARRKVLRG